MTFQATKHCPFICVKHVKFVGDTLGGHAVVLTEHDKTNGKLKCKNSWKGMENIEVDDVVRKVSCIMLCIIFIRF